MSSNYPPGVNDNDPYFDLPDAGEDDEPDYDQDILIEDYCHRCGCPLTEADYEAEECTQCHKGLYDRLQIALEFYGLAREI